MPAPKPIVTPGPTPQGPPGWEEKQQKRMESGELTVEKQSTSYHGDQPTDQLNANPASEPEGEHKGGMDKLKDQVHKVGEKMALVPPKAGEDQGTSAERSAHRQVRDCAAKGSAAVVLTPDQDASTMPE